MGALSENSNKYFWSHEKVPVTGHTGFKGSWLTYWLKKMTRMFVVFLLIQELLPRSGMNYASICRVLMLDWYSWK